MARRSTPFVREATGLVREVSPWDMVMFNVLTMGITVAPLGSLSFGLWAFPGANWTITILLTVVLGLSVWIPYAFLGATMPRSGGDYVFQSRILAAPLAFAITTGAWVFWNCYFVVWNGYSLGAYGIAPFLSTLGTQLNQPGLVQASHWFLTADAQTILGLILIVVCFPQLIFPLRYYAKVQRWLLFPLCVLGFALMVAAVFSVSPSTFASNFNTWAQTSGASGNYYQYVIDTAKQNGFNSNPGFSWFDTFGLMTQIWGAFAWAFFSTYFGGEVKRASAVKNQLIMIPGSVLIVASFFIIIGLAATNVVGQAFFASANYLLNVHPDLLNASVSPNMIFFAFVARPEFSVALSLILLFAMITTEYQYNFNTLIPGIRVMFAEAFDRLYPRAFSDVSERWHTPVKTITFISCVGVAQILAWRFFFVNTGSYMTLAGAMATLPAMIFTCVAAAVFPFRKKTKEMYDASPAAKLKVAGIPVIAIAGVIGVVFLCSIVYFWVTVPALGMSSPQAVGYVIGAYVVAALYYFAVKAYRKKQGIDIELAFKTIPPE